MHSFITLSDSTSNDKVCFQTFFLNKMQLCFMGHVIFLLYYLRIVNPFSYSLQYVIVKWFDSYMIIGGWASLHFCVTGCQTTICAMKNHLENLFSFFSNKVNKTLEICFVKRYFILFYFFFFWRKINSSISSYQILSVHFWLTLFLLLLLLCLLSMSH